MIELEINNNYAGRITMLNIKGVEFTKGLPIDFNYEKSVQYYSDRRIILISNMDFSRSSIKICFMDNGLYTFNFGCHMAYIEYLTNGFILHFKE